MVALTSPSSGSQALATAVPPGELSSVRGYGSCTGRRQTESACIAAAAVACMAAGQRPLLAGGDGTGAGSGMKRDFRAAEEKGIGNARA